MRAASTRRPWTETEYAAVREAEGRLTARQVAHVLGRTVSAVHQARERLELGAAAVRHGADFTEFVRARHSEGYSDAETAAAWRAANGGACERHTVGARRLSLGLPDNNLSRRRRDRVRSRTRRQLDEAGVASLSALRAAVCRRRAEAAGWPADLRLRAVQILNALWDRGPMTRREIADAIGAPWLGSRASLHSNDPEGSYLAHLIGRGLCGRSDHPDDQGPDNADAWVIVGGESGPHARPMHPKWARDIVQQCAASGVSCFVKQMGGRPVGLQLADRRGGDPDEWPEDLRVRQIPGTRAPANCRTGGRTSPSPGCGGSNRSRGGETGL